LARRKYLGRANEELDAMFAELESIDRSTKTGRRKHRALSNKIRRKRERRVLSGIRSLFGSRKYPVPATASGAASTMGFPGVPESPIGIGTMAEAPPAPDIPIEEITVDAKRRRRSEPNIELAELPVTQSRAPSLRAQVPFGIYTGELAEQFGNEPEIQQSMMSKLGRNQLRSLERRKRKVAQYPDAYPPDYATPEGMFKYAEGKTIEGNRMRGLGISALGAYMANRDTSKDEEEIKELTQEEMEKMEQILAEIEREKAFYGEDVDAWSPENMNSNYAGGGQLMGHAQQLANAGRGEDSMLMHVTPSEVQGIASLAPGMMTINPQTGLPEAGFFKDILGFALPFLGTMVGIPPWLTGAVGAKLRGGDFKDMLLGAGTGALMGKLGGKLGEIPDIGKANLASEAATKALSSPEAFSSLASTPDAFGNLITKAGLDEAQSAAFQSALKSGVDPMAHLASAGIAPAQITSLSSGLSDIAKTNLPNTFGQNIKNIGAGLPAVTDALMTPAGLGSIAGVGLQAQRDMTRRWDQSILDREEQKKKEEEEIYRMNPENIPYRGGGSLYKNRYINGNWS